MPGVFTNYVIAKQVLDKLAYNAVRSVQYIEIVLDPDTTSDQGAPAVNFTDYTKVALFVLNVGSAIIAGNAGSIPNIRWKVVSNSNVTVFHGAVGGTDNGTAIVGAIAVEFY